MQHQYLDPRWTGANIYASFITSYSITRAVTVLGV